MKILLFRWIKSNYIMLINSGSLVGTTAVTSLLGFVYWWIAARYFPLEAIGVASASISAMTLLGGFCILGLSTLLLTELPRQPEKAKALISTALVTVGVIGGCVGAIFALAAFHLSPSFKSLGANFLDVFTFACGVSITAITLVLDAALIGLLRGKLQFGRNALFAVLKLAALCIVGLFFSEKLGITIYGTWATANILSLMALTGFYIFKKGRPGKECLPQWGLLRKLGMAAVQHHLLNITLQFPTLALPVLVTVLLSAKMNAWFYVSWMIVTFIFYIPVALTMVLHTINAAQPSTLAHKARVTISIALVTSILGTLVLEFATKQVLGMFGTSYVEQAAWTLRILVLASFPLIVKNHYLSISRIHDRIKGAMVLIAPGSFLELCAAALGAHLGGLMGLSLGWVIAIYIESLFMLPTIMHVIFPAKTPSLVMGQELMGQDDTTMEAIWLVDTFTLPSIKSSTGEIRVDMKDLLSLGSEQNSKIVQAVTRSRSDPHIGHFANVSREYPTYRRSFLKKIHLRRV